MAGTIAEAPESRAFSLGYDRCSREMVYNVIGAADESEVLSLLLGAAPAAYDGLYLSSWGAEPFPSTDGVQYWKARAAYEILPSEYSFDTGGGSSKITQSYGTIASYTPDGSTAPDFGGAINVSEDAVEGVEIPIPKYDWSQTAILPDADITVAYKQYLFNLTGKQNAAAFDICAAGEALFLGAAGSKRANGLWTITYKFSASPNVSGLSIGGMTITKLGWDYLWIRYADFADTTAFCRVKKPIAAYVERVHQPGDFTGIILSG